MFYAFIGLILFSGFLIIRMHRNSTALWYAVILIGFCLSMLGLTFYSVYIWDYSYMLRKLFFNLNKYIWIFIYYLKLDSGIVMRMVNSGAALFSYAAVGMSVSILDKSRKSRIYLLAAILPLLMILVYDPYILSFIYRTYKLSVTGMAFKSFLDYINLINSTWIKLYIFASFVLLLWSYKSYTNQNYRKRIFCILLGAAPMYFLFVILFYWVPQPFIVLRDFTVMKNINAWEVSEYLTLDFQYGKFTYIAVICLTYISISLLLFAIIKYKIFDKDIARDRLIFSSTYKTANRGAQVFSHSIKNQIVAIRMLGENISRNMDNDDKNIKYVNSIISICTETIAKLNTLKAISVSVRAEYVSFEVSDIMLEIIERRIPEEDNIIVRCDESSSFNILADRELFREAVENIIVNSVEAMDEKRSGVLRIFFEREGKWGIINISDNGIGIPKSNLSKIFSPFFTTKPTINNWGIGLSFSKSVIESLKGEIQVSSELNSGTLFRIYIPIYRGKRT